jgi:hypothetical protein
VRAQVRTRNQESVDPLGKVCHSDRSRSASDGGGRNLLFLVTKTARVERKLLSCISVLDSLFLKLLVNLHLISGDHLVGFVGHADHSH